MSGMVFLLSHAGFVVHRMVMVTFFLGVYLPGLVTERGPPGWF